MKHIVIHIRLERKIKEELAKTAQEKGLTLSALARMYLLTMMKKEKI